MTLNQHINLVLKEWDYQKALALYKTHGSNQMLIYTFSRGENSFNRERLQEELEKLKTIDTALPEVTVSNTKDAYVDYRTAPEPLIQAKKQYQKDMARMKVLHAGLEQHPDNASRFKAAKEIILLNEKIHQAYELIDHYRKTGTIKEKPLAIKEDYYQIDRAQLSKMYENKRTYIAKAKKAIVKAEKELEEGGDKQQLETLITAKKEKITQLTAEREAIQKVLNHG